MIDRLTAADWPDGKDHGPALVAIIELLSQGIEAAEEAGETLLHARVRAIWRRALAAGPAASLDLTLETLKQDDGLDACVSACWMPASALAASPRRFVRLLGLNSARWPRTMAEDRLLSDHIVPTAELDPLPVAAADRRDFATILATTESEIVLSRARRDEEGRLLGRSTLLLGVEADETYLPRQPRCHARLQRDRSAHRAARGVPDSATGDRRVGLLVRLAARGNHAPRRCDPSGSSRDPRHPRPHPVGELAAHAVAQPARGSSGTTVSVGARRRAATIP